jgi:hypothetical protein
MRWDFAYGPLNTACRGKDTKSRRAQSSLYCSQTIRRLWISTSPDRVISDSHLKPYHRAGKDIRGAEPPEYAASNTYEPSGDEARARLQAARTGNSQD